MNEILRIKFGSWLYGTNTPDSDLDFKAIYLPTAREVVLGNYKKTICNSRPKAECERNNKDDVDVEVFSLDRYLELLMEGQTVALDILFAPQYMYTFAQEGELGAALLKEIYDNKEKLLTRNVNAFVGYARQQAAKYGIKGSRMDSLKRVMELLTQLGDNHERLSTYEEHFVELVKECEQLVSLEKTPLVEIVMLKGPKGLIDSPHLRVNGRSIPFHATLKYAKDIVSKMLDGYGQRAHKANLDGGKDYKALSHAVRVNNEALELLTTGHITFPRPDRILLLKIKLREMPYDEIAEMIEKGLADLCEAHEKSTLRDQPDREWANDLIYKTYSNIVKQG